MPEVVGSSDFYDRVGDMDHSSLAPSFEEYAVAVIHRLQNDELACSFLACRELLEDAAQQIPSWQIALPAIACVAAGGEHSAGSSVAVAWFPAFLASEIFDHLEDREYAALPQIGSPEVMMNLASSLIFLAFHHLGSIPEPGKESRAIRLFAAAGFEAASGQHRDLVKEQISVEKSLDEYWELVILKSGSVFRAATALGAVMGTENEQIIQALSDYGTALGVMLQLLDDCRDVFTPSDDLVQWEISLPLLLYLMIRGEEDITFPAVSTKAELSEIFIRVGVVNAIASLLLEWKGRALDCLELLADTVEKRLLQGIPSAILERLNPASQEANHGSSS
jgi:hypothetical protein